MDENDNSYFNISTFLRQMNAFFTHPSIYLFIHLFIHPSIHPFNHLQAKVNPKDRKPVDNNKVMLAEFGSLSLEFRYLSKHTNDPEYAQLVDRLYDHIQKLNHTSGLLPLTISYYNSYDFHDNNDNNVIIMIIMIGSYLELYYRIS